MPSPKHLQTILAILVCSFLFSCKQKQKIATEVDSPFNDIIERNQYEFDITKDPRTGKIPEGVIEASYLQGKNLPSKEEISSLSNSPAVLNTYTAVGPNNLGGRTRAFAYDVRYNTNQVIIAGSVSSGVMRTTDGGLSWTKVSGTSNIHDITCVAQDPRAGFQDTWYLGTGEALGNSSSANNGSATVAFRTGFGVYKSTDNGLTWTRQTNSNLGAYESFDTRRDLITRIVVDPTNGNIYIAVLQGIYRSIDGGANWANVLGLTAGGFSSIDVTDIVCTSTGVLYAGLAGTATITSAFDGVWTSSTGASGTWTRIASSATVAGWKANGSYGRLVLALAPSNQNILYAVYENFVAGAPGADFFKYDASTGTWSANRSANLPNQGSNNGTFTTQGGYDLALTVKPDDPNFVILGGTNAYTSTDGFATVASFKRIGGYAAFNSNASYTNHHPDQHIYVFEPGSNIKMVSGDDGGIQVTTDVTAATVSWSSLNNNYQTYQYYYTAIDPTLGSTKYIGGAQDNGTTYRNAGTNSMLQVLTGDGVSVGISSGNVNHYCGFQNGDFFRRGSGDAVSTGFPLKPSAETSKGLFVTLFYLNPDNTEDLYYASGNRLWRNTGASVASTTVGVGAGQWQQMTSVSTATGIDSIMSFATTRGTYNTSHKLYIGTNNAKIFRLDDPRNAAAATAPVNISPAGIIAGSVVIGIAVAPQNDDTVLAVISNYGVPSVFWTGTATSATPVWYNVEGTGVGSLSLPSFRSCAIVAKTGGIFEYYVGTSVGLYSTSSIVGTSQATADGTSWVKEGSGIIDQAVVTSLPVRNNDNTMLVGTHGNGMFVANILSPLPITLNSFDAIKSGSNVKLNWSVSSEINVKQYFVERKYPNENSFTQIASLSATTATQGIKNYSLIDNNVSFNKGNIQYRLKVMDIDNKSSLSKIVSIRGNNSFVSNVYPTIVKDNIHITVADNSTLKKFNIAIADNYGRILLNKQYDYTNTNLPVSQLPSGSYYLVISANEEKFVTKFIKQ